MMIIPSFFFPTKHVSRPFFHSITFSANFGILVRKCYAFDDLQDSSVRLVDSRGCSERKLLSPFEYDADTGSATATLYSMFRYVPVYVYQYGHKLCFERIAKKIARK